MIVLCENIGTSIPILYFIVTCIVFSHLKQVPICNYYITTSTLYSFAITENFMDSPCFPPCLTTPASATSLHHLCLLSLLSIVLSSLTLQCLLGQRRSSFFFFIHFLISHSLSLLEASFCSLFFYCLVSRHYQYFLSLTGSSRPKVILCHSC